MAVDYESKIGVPSPGTAATPGASTGIMGGFAKARENANSGPKRIGPMRRQFVKKRFRDMMAGQTVSDQEKRAYEQAAIQGAMQAQAAQDVGAARIAQATAGGSPLVSGQMKASAKQAGEATRDVAAKTASATNKLAAALKDQREAQTLAAGERLIASNKEDMAMGLDMALKVAEIGAQIAGLKP